MGRKSLIPAIEAKIGKPLKDYIVEAIKEGKEPEQIAKDIGLGKSLTYSLIKKYGLKAKLKQTRYAAAAGVKEGELKKLIDDYIDWKKLSNFSAATIRNTRDALYAYLWWLDFAKIPADLNHSVNDTEGGVKPFFHYLTTTVDRFGGQSTASRRPMKPITVKSYIKQLRAFIQWLEDREKIEESTLKRMVRDVPLPKIGKRNPEDLPDEIIGKLLNSFDDSFAGVRNKTITVWFLETGMRLDGVVNLEVNQFNIDTSWCPIIEKGNKERNVHLSLALVEQLKIYLPMREPIAKCNKLWIQEDGTWFKRNNFRYLYYKLNKKFRKDIERLAPGSRIHPHIFRHIFARFLADANMGVQAIADMGGWDDWDLVKLYAEAHAKKLAWNEFEKASPLKKIKGGTENG